MSLRHYGTILWQGKWITIVTVAITVIATIVLTALTPPKYISVATLRIGTASTGALDSQRYDLGYADRLMNTYSKIAVSGPVLKELARRLSVPNVPSITTDIPANTELLRISAEGDRPELVAQAANTVADLVVADFNSNYSLFGKSALDILNKQLAQNEDELNQARTQYAKLVASNTQDSEQGSSLRTLIDFKEQTYGRLLTQYQQIYIIQVGRSNIISVVEPATPPSKPAKPQPELYLALGLLIGLVAGVGLAFLLENLELYRTVQPQMSHPLSQPEQIRTS